MCGETLPPMSLLDRAKEKACHKVVQAIIGMSGRNSKTVSCDYSDLAKDYFLCPRSIDRGYIISCVTGELRSVI